MPRNLTSLALTLLVVAGCSSELDTRQDRTSFALGGRVATYIEVEHPSFVKWFGTMRITEGVGQGDAIKTYGTSGRSRIISATPCLPALHGSCRPEDFARTWGSAGAGERPPLDLGALAPQTRAGHTAIDGIDVVFVEQLAPGPYPVVVRCELHGGDAVDQVPAEVAAICARMQPGAATRAQPDAIERENVRLLAKCPRGSRVAFADKVDAERRLGMAPPTMRVQADASGHMDDRTLHVRLAGAGPEALDVTLWSDLFDADINQGSYDDGASLTPDDVGRNVIRSAAVTLADGSSIDLTKGMHVTIIARTLERVCGRVDLDDDKHTLHATFDAPIGDAPPTGR